MSQGSFEFTRVIGVRPHKSQALVMSPSCSQVTPPCSHSIHTASNPRGPMKSMISLVRLPEMVVTTPFSRSLSLAGLGLIDDTKFTPF